MTRTAAISSNKARPHRASGSALPYLALAVGVIALGFSALFVRWANAPGPVTGAYRMGLASLALLPLAMRRGRRRPWPRRGVLLAVLGGTSLALDLVFWNTSVNMTTATNAALFGNTAPLWVAIAGWAFFGERLPLGFWIGLGITFFGAGTVAGSDFLTHPSIGWGDVLGLLAGVFYAGYYLATQFGRRHLDSARYVWLSGAASATVLLLICLLAGLPLIGYSRTTYLAFLGAGLVTQAIGYLVVGYALGHLPASLVSPIMIGQPVMTALLGIPLLGETPTTPQLLGGAAVILGIYLINRAHHSQTIDLAA